LDLVKNNQVETLQSKVDSLKDEIKMWEIEKTRLTHRVARLKRTICELEWSLAQKRGIAPTNQESKDDRH
jgi:peptidoglycan hydrolase CwlO-like protein